MCTREGTIDKLEEERDVENFIDYVEAYFQLTPSDEQNGVRELNQYFNTQTYKHQTNSHHDSFCMSVSNHSNGLASTIYFKCNREKQDKRLNNHYFALHLPEKNKHHSSEPRYAAIKCYTITFQWVFMIQLIGGGGGRELEKLLGVLNLPSKGFEKKNLAKIEAHAGMEKRLVRYLKIEEALQEEIKQTLEYNNQSYDYWCALS